MLVMKFGGTSLGDLPQIGNAAMIIEKALPRKPLVVVSAHSKVTDMLLAAAHEAQKGNVNGPIEGIRKRHSDILKGLKLDPKMHESMFDDLELILKGISLIRELTPRTLDMVASFGERASCRTMAAYMRTRGHANCKAYDAWELGMRTDGNFMKARPLAEAFDLVDVEVNRRSDELIITTGFIGKDKDGNITTLGRGGSDYTAAIFGAGLGAEEIQIWKDVDGVMTADPRIVPNAQTLESLSFYEAAELAYFGGKVLHPSTMQPAVEKNIPIRVLNTFMPDHPGTLIVKAPKIQKDIIKCITAKRNIFLLYVESPQMLGRPGIVAQLSGILAKHDVSIDLIATSEISISFTVDSEKNLDRCVKELEDLDFKPTVTVAKEKAIVCVVGHGMRHTVGLAGRIFSTLGNAAVNIQLISQAWSEINITMVVDNADVPKATQALHKEFFEK